ncbi:glycosyltransferase family 2 protein [Alcanivorax sp. S6407]|uniref:glycosyltransferase family 2 protein n=1 Tax=Alcanivorax sp. S6407 TaxID=2926424 RepID=UPI001FF616F6|nr:glycosyltransferase family 2 protein [Alcanivorax sp. S6407]
MGNGEDLVTFAVFAYNQEKYIRAAVEGAFSQDYGNLEIILSDDFSSDLTFEIMKEMAANYNGSHKVILRQSSENLGLGLHVKEVSDLAQGEFIVVAAGDDVSLPHRTRAIIDVMKKDGTKFAASNYNRIDESGAVLDYNLKNDYSDNNLWALIDSDSSCFANGAAAAYDINFFRGALNSAIKTIKSGWLFNEDILFAAYAAAIDEKPSEYTGSSLLNYRVVSSSLSNFASRDNSYREEIRNLKREIFRFSTRLAVLDAIIELSDSYPSFASKLNMSVISTQRRLCEIELAASSDRFVDRFKNIFYAGNLDELRICLARVFGLKVLAALRFLSKKIKQI